MSEPLAGGIPFNAERARSDMARTQSWTYEQNALTSLRRAAEAVHEDARETFLADALRYMRLALELQK